MAYTESGNAASRNRGLSNRSIQKCQQYWKNTVVISYIGLIYTVNSCKDIISNAGYFSLPNVRKKPITMNSFAAEQRKIALVSSVDPKVGTLALKR